MRGLASFSRHARSSTLTHAQWEETKGAMASMPLVGREWRGGEEGGERARERERGREREREREKGMGG